jgi:hypothetical protein
MLTNNYLLSSLSSLKDFVSPSTQILQGNGYDGIIDILQNMRGVTYPCVILESGGSGSVQVVEGPVDTYTQSLWVMGNLGRGEDEDALFRAMKALTMKVFAKLLQDRREGTHPEVQELDFQRFTYMQRWGGPNARGYELVLTFRENYSLLLTQEDFK